MTDIRCTCRTAMALADGRCGRCGLPIQAQALPQPIIAQGEGIDMVIQPIIAQGEGIDTVTGERFKYTQFKLGPWPKGMVPVTRVEEPIVADHQPGLDRDRDVLEQIEERGADIQCRPDPRGSRQFTDDPSRWGFLIHPPAGMHIDTACSIVAVYCLKNRRCEGMFFNGLEIYCMFGDTAEQLREKFDAANYPAPRDKE